MTANSLVIAFLVVAILATTLSAQATDTADVEVYLEDAFGRPMQGEEVLFTSERNPSTSTVLKITNSTGSASANLVQGQWSIETECGDVRVAIAKDEKFAFECGATLFMPLLSVGGGR